MIGLVHVTKFGLAPIEMLYITTFQPKRNSVNEDKEGTC